MLKEIILKTLLMCTNDRELPPGTLVLHFKHEEDDCICTHLYIIERYVKDCETSEEKVIYRNVVDNNVWIRNRKEFESLVDKEKYPNIKQKYRFVKVNDINASEVKNGSN